MPSSSFSMFTDADEGNGHEASSKDLRFPSVSLYKEPKDLEVPHNLCPERTRPSFCEHDDECFASASIEARKMNRRTVWETETTQDQRTYSCRSDNRGQTTYEASRRGDLSRSVKNRPGKESEIGEIPRAIREGGLTD